MITTAKCPPTSWRAVPLAIAFFLRDSIRLGRKKRRIASRVRFMDLIENKRTSLVAIDCGANVGKISEELLDAGYHVHAFEPDPMALVDFKARLGGRANLVLHESAVGTSTGTATLYRHKDVLTKKKRVEASSLIQQPKCDDRNTVQVSVTDLPAFVASQTERVGILKLDIEGYEVEILSALLDRGQHHDIDHIVAETHERFSLPLAWRTAKLRARVHQNKIANIDLDHL